MHNYGCGDLQGIDTFYCQMQYLLHTYTNYVQ